MASKSKACCAGRLALTLLAIPAGFVVHGGPMEISKAYRITDDERAAYPVLQLLQKDVLVLKPNYRGSIGRGQALTELRR